LPLTQGWRYRAACEMPRYVSFYWHYKVGLIKIAKNKKMMSIVSMQLEVSQASSEMVVCKKTVT